MSYYEKFCKEDVMMEPIYKTYVEEGHGLFYKDVVSIARFLGIFAVGCRRLKADGVADMMNERLLAFHWILTSKLGKRFGRRMSAKKTFGIEDLYEQAFGIASLGVGTTRLINRG